MIEGRIRKKLELGVCSADAPLGAGGVSDSWLGQKKNVSRIFDLFRAFKPEWVALAPVPLHQLTEAHVRNRSLWEALTTFLVRDYLIHVGEFKGGKLKFRNVLNYLRSAMRTIEGLLQATAGAATREFFSCLDKNSKIMRSGCAA